ncbi:MAG: hypothetical protein E7352_01870 [Clostridiales bacterium]|nr:hypothetical protein [Clostridiales bacterium]
MKKLKNRWENELKTAIPALSDSVKNTAIPKAENQSSIVKTSSLKEGKERKNMLKKRTIWAVVSGGVACACALAIILPNALKDSPPIVSAKEMKVMNVSCNPSVEFVLDENNVVVSANALNEEGNLVVSAEVFVGKGAEDAVCLFAEIAQESGFLVAGEAKSVGADNQISIAFSGDVTIAETLYGGVRARVEEYFLMHGIDGEIQKTDAVTEEQLENILSECMPHIEVEKIREMNYSTLVETLAEKRKETENIFSQELKTAYYEMKAFAIEQAELETIKANANAITSAILDGVYTEYTKVISDIENFRMEYLVGKDSPYQQALAAYRTAKIEYLNYRSEIAQLEQEVTQEILDVLSAYEETLDSLHNQLLQAGETAHESLDVMKGQVKELFVGISDRLQEWGIDKEDIAENILAERNKADKEFLAKFTEKCEKEINEAHGHWTAMKEALKGNPNKGGEGSGGETA